MGPPKRFLHLLEGRNPSNQNEILGYFQFVSVLLAISSSLQLSLSPPFCGSTILFSAFTTPSMTKCFLSSSLHKKMSASTFSISRYCVFLNSSLDREISPSSPFIFLLPTSDLDATFSFCWLLGFSIFEETRDIVWTGMKKRLRISRLKRLGNLTSIL